MSLPVLYAVFDQRGNLCTDAVGTEARAKDLLRILECNFAKEGPYHVAEVEVILRSSFSA